MCDNHSPWSTFSCPLIFCCHPLHKSVIKCLARMLVLIRQDVISASSHRLHLPSEKCSSLNPLASLMLCLSLKLRQAATSAIQESEIHSYMAVGCKIGREKWRVGSITNLSLQFDHKCGLVKPKTDYKAPCLFPLSLGLRVQGRDWFRTGLLAVIEDNQAETRSIILDKGHRRGQLFGGVDQESFHPEGVVVPSFSI